jgi:hypothetical protein
VKASCFSYICERSSENNLSLIAMSQSSNSPAAGMAKVSSEAFFKQGALVVYDLTQSFNNL